MVSEAFSKKDLKNLIVPLFVEQLLVMLVGVADTLMISYAGEAAVSGVTLVNMFNTIFLYLFTALASGGAVIVSRYIGGGEEKNGNRASGQLVMLAVVLSVVLTISTVLLKRNLLGMFFPKVEESVYNSALIYLGIYAYSYPALALYSSGAAIYRSMGKTKVTMLVSAMMNVINIIGNAIGVFVLRAGVAGVAWSSFKKTRFLNRNGMTASFLCLSFSSWRIL